MDRLVSAMRTFYRLHEEYGDATNLLNKLEAVFETALIRHKK